MSQLTRRHFIATSTAASFAPLGAQAAAPMLGPLESNVRRMNLGAFEVTTMLAGSRVAENPQEIFGKNVSAEEFSAVSAEADLPIDKTRCGPHR